MISNTVLGAVIVTALVAAVCVQASVLSSANDYVTTLQTSQAANHELFFTTSSGVSEGQTVTLTFGSGFSLTTIAEDDIDIADDGTELTTAASCAGTEKASASVSGNVITLTVCAGDGGAIAAGSSVRIRIGTNATNSGIGVNRIVNPSTASNHFVTIGGTFGDFGSIVLPIKSSSSSISVTATVSSGGGGGGGSGGNNSDNSGNDQQVDSTAPVISQIIVSSVSKSGATISWTTNEDANSKILYGLTNAFELGMVFDVSLSKSHALSLSSLQEGKTYFFQIKSADQSNNIATSATQTFSTLDETAPVISNFSVTNVTKSSATIVFNTNESASTVIDYGLTTEYGQSKTNTAFVTDHSVVLSGLQSGKTYHARVKTQDASSNVSTSLDQTFATTADLPPTNVAGLTILVGDKTLTLKWTNPTEDDFAGVRVLRCSSGFPTNPTDAACTVILDNSLLETLTQTGLTNDTTYYYGVFAKDSASQFASGALDLGKPRAPEKEVLKDVCGDNFCSATETTSSCPVDCVTPPKVAGTTCGDTMCAETESSASCPADCAVQTQKPATGTAPESGGVCGNSVCESDESAFTCLSDCKVSVKPTSGSEVASLKFEDAKFIVAAGSIILSSTNGYIEVLPNTPLSVSVPAEKLGSGVLRVTLAIGANTYILRPETKSPARAKGSLTMAVVNDSESSASVLYYNADVLAPSGTSLNPVTIIAEYANNQLVTASSFLRVVAPGSVKGIIDGEEAVLSGVKLTLYGGMDSISAVWDGSPYGANNPTESTTDGLIAWYVPNGLYRVRAEQDKFFPYDTAVFEVKNNIVNPHIRLTPLVKIEEEPLKTATEAVLSPVVINDAVKKIAASIERVSESKAAKIVSQGLESVRENPVVKQAADASVPTLVVSAGTSVVMMSVAFDFLPFIQYLFTAPVLFFGRRKRKAFGVIYNAISKEPIGLSVVRLYQLKDEQEKIGKLVKSRVTDKGGRFYFLVQPGLYRLSVTKVGFQFPSLHLKSKQEDVQYTDLYHGELLRVRDADAVITPNIPLDPSQEAKFSEPKNIKAHARLRVIQHIIALSGVTASFVFAIIRPNVLAAAMCALQIGIYLFVRRLARPRKPKSWGIVYDKNTGRPLSNVIARIFEPKYNKLLETQVTDAKGRYSFLLGPAEYYAVFEKEGYRSTQIKPIDFTKDTEAKDFSQDINLFSKDGLPK